ncbi:MAG: thiamine phosphate synthase [Luteitalea sp.]|nr:thiamine phosphate synthase [Luteitalea sp.]
MAALPSSLYVVCDAEACARAGWSLPDFAAACLDGGARFLQIRDKRNGGRAMLEAALAVVARAAAVGATVIVNDRADIARLANAAGVHVGQDDLAPADARTVVGDSAIVGLSTHTDAQVQDAVRQPISYLAIGPVFGTVSKRTGDEAVGLDRVSQAGSAARDAGLPLVAIGGITLDRAREVIAAGATSVAVIGDMFVGRDPAIRVRQYLHLLGRSIS